MKRDIETREDLESLMSAFYSVAVSDSEIGHHFDDLDIAAHLPIIVDFWDKALFARPVYYGNPLAVHQRLHKGKSMLPAHFARWVEIFVMSVDDLFDGELAEKAKYQARMVADSLNQRLNEDQRCEGLNKHLRPY